MGFFDSTFFDREFFDVSRVSGRWEDNQLADAAAPSILIGYLEAREETAGEPILTRWELDNTTANNVTEAAVTHEFDYARVTMPLDSCSVTIENAAYDDEPNEDYDFVRPETGVLLKNPTSIALSLGYRYFDGSTETVQSTRQIAQPAEVSDDDLYVTLSGLSFASVLDDDIFYGGRYDAAGIPASTLFAEILDEARFPTRGWWSYRLGDAGCVVSATTPLWTTEGFTYYTVDAALDSVMVDIPIPPVSHREALIMLAAYSGAYLIHRSDGSLDVTTTLPTRGDYTLAEAQVYDRPKTISGANISRIGGALHSYTVAAATETIVESDFLILDLSQVELRITHDAIANGSVSITGGTISGTPTYNTYSTLFLVDPTATTIRATLTGKRVTIAERRFGKSYLASGDVVELACPIASDPTLTLAMYDQYEAVTSATRYEFSMRDDPSIAVGDRLWLQMMSERSYGRWNYRIGDALCVVSTTQPLYTDLWGKVVPVVVTCIKRKFNGGLDADYTVVTDIDPE
jgi:hypothetical protein